MLLRRLVIAEELGSQFFQGRLTIHAAGPFPSFLCPSPHSWSCVTHRHIMVRSATWTQKYCCLWILFSACTQDLMCILDLSHVSTSLVLYTHVTRDTMVAAEKLSSETEKGQEITRYICLSCAESMFGLWVPRPHVLLSLVIERKPLALLRVLSIPCWEGGPAKLAAQRNSEDKVELILAFSPQNCILFWPGQSHATVILADYGAREPRLLSVLPRSNFEWMNWGLGETAKWGGDDGEATRT